MDKEFYIEKLKIATTEQLQNLINLENEENKELMNLVRQEAERRNIKLTPAIKSSEPKDETTKKKDDIKWANRLNDLLWGLNNPFD